LLLPYARKPKNKVVESRTRKTLLIATLNGLLHMIGSYLLRYALRPPEMQIRFNSELTHPSLAAPRTRHMIPLYFPLRFSWPSYQSETLGSHVQILGLPATMVTLTIPASVAKRKQACTSCRQRKKKCDVRVMMY
ncbi:hypothetical protein COCCADRAFT_87621, partial [Bipolaris zeicola 26-R-13]